MAETARKFDAPSELPWLRDPTQEDRAALRASNALIGIDAVVQLAGLADRRWDASDFALIGRKLRKLLAAMDGDWRAQARQNGFTPFSLLILASNTVAHMLDPLAALALARGIILQFTLVEYQEPEAWIAENASALAQQPDATLISLDRRSLRLEAGAGDSKEAEARIDAAISRIASLTARINALTGHAVIVETLPQNASDAQGSVESWLAGAPRFMTSRFNQRLAVATASNPFLLFDVAGIADLVGLSVWDAGRFWYTAKFPFSPACVPLYSYRLVALLASLTGRSRRVLVLDLDNTLWGGIVGDDGVEGLLIGGNSALGQAHAAVQKMALTYKERGVLLCVASKNTHEIAIAAFRDHPEMLIREGDVTQFSINWQDKAGNILAMSRALNLGLDAFVFVDDNPVERKQVRDALPSVAVPELPEDAASWLPVIQAAGYFEQHSFSEEDRKRSSYYQNNARRAALQESAAGDEKGFLESLRMVMTVSPFDSVGRKRIAQLIAKSNQFNLTTTRYSEAQVAAMEKDRNVETLQIRLEDIFGDNGMIAVVICRKSKDIWEVDNWLMSCRVLGRGVERATLQILVNRAMNAGATEIRGRYIPTNRNGIVKDHYSKLGFTRLEERDDGQSIWSLRLNDYLHSDDPMTVVETAGAIRGVVDASEKSA